MTRRGFLSLCASFLAAWIMPKFPHAVAQVEALSGMQIPSTIPSQIGMEVPGNHVFLPTVNK